ncbi:MAG: glutathione S-transferase [Hoeflea sp.]|uniref:glutathione S-transferase n=1 Tax=Hoeflea sp. TaxID=1940281 RepID=UPI0032ED6070
MSAQIQDRPVLYSFRRCPYAIRARLAIAVSGVGVELREVVLRDKPKAFLEASPSATVPCLVTAGQAGNGAAADAGAEPAPKVIDESLDIMIWALEQNDPEAWLDMPDAGREWIARCDGPFKQALDRTKYAPRYPDADPEAARDRAQAFLSDLDSALDGDWIFGRPTLADFAILPFVRQFAFIDKQRFDARPWPRLQPWLERFLGSERFGSVMRKYPQWHDGDKPTTFP